jgi:hypothetical protein
VQGALDGKALPIDGRTTYDQTSGGRKAHVTVAGANHYAITDANPPSGADADPTAPTLDQATAQLRTGRITGLLLRWVTLKEESAKSLLQAESANGENVTAVGLTMSGTSMASPAVVGSIALLQSAQSVLKIWPEGNRALLFAGALRNVGSHPGVTGTGAAVSTANGRWFADLTAGRDGYDGAGALDVLESYRIAQSRYNAAVVTNRGWDIGTMTAASFDASNVFTKTYTFKAPVGATQARVALAWNSTATVTDTGATDLYNSALGMDLDVRVYDAVGTQVARSSSWDNSYEVVDFVPKAGQTYTVKVNRFSTKPGAWTWYGIAFTAI